MSNWRVTKRAFNSRVGCNLRLLPLINIWAATALFFVSAGHAQDCTFTGSSLQLISQAQVDSFQLDYGQCSRLPAGLRISSVSLDDPISNLFGLFGLESIDGNLVITGNDSLPNLLGLGSLVSVAGSLDVDDNSGLSSLVGLEKLQSVGSELRIRDNPLLINLDPLANLTTLGGGLSFQGNTSLQNIEGLSGVTVIPANLSLFQSALTNLQGLANLTEINGNFSVQLSDLIDFSGLESLQTIGGSLFLSSNTQLSSTSGLEQLSSIGNRLTVQSNSSLTDCAALAPVLGFPVIPYDANSDSVGDLVTIDDTNGVGAQSPDDCLLALPVNIQISEGIEVNDGLSASAFDPGINISISEVVAVSDSPSIFEPVVDISITEDIEVNATAAVAFGPPPVTISLMEGIAVSASASERDPNSIIVTPFGQLPTAGLEITVEGLGFMPLTLVQLFIESTPVLIGEGTADEFGRVRIVAQVPDFFTPGAHTLVLRGQGMDGAARILRQGITVSQDLRAIFSNSFEATPN